MVTIQAACIASWRPAGRSPGPKCVTRSNSGGSPQPVATNPNEYVRAVRWNELPGVQGEDCLTLSVWTPGITDGVKRGVISLPSRRRFANGTSSNPAFDGIRWRDSATWSW